MDFSFDDTQREIADLAASVLRREPEQPWKALDQAGLLTLARPERLGGDGLGVIETCVVLAEVGRAAVDTPALATLALGVLPIVHMGTLAQQDRWLASPGVLTAAMRGQVTVNDSRAGTDRDCGAGTDRDRGAGADRDRGVGTDRDRRAGADRDRRAGADRDRGVGTDRDRRVGTADAFLTGTKTQVPYAEHATCILVVANDLVYSVHRQDVVLTKTHSSSGQPEYTVRLDDTPGELLGSARHLQAFALAGICAVGDGLLAGALELTAEHVGNRRQFGKPLATFQAVAQQIADVYIAARTLHLATWSAIWRLGTGRDARSALDVAAYWLTEELPKAMHTCHHLHGGIGVDISYPMHRFYALGKDLVRFAGGVEERLDQLCSSI